MNDDLILSYYKDPAHYGKFEGTILTSDAANMSCGDEISLFVKIEGGKIQKMQYEGAGCSICLASAEIACRFAEKSGRFITPEELFSLIEMESDHKRIKCAEIVLDAQTKLKN